MVRMARKADDNPSETKRNSTGISTGLFASRFVSMLRPENVCTRDCRHLMIVCRVCSVSLDTSCLLGITFVPIVSMCSTQGHLMPIVRAAASLFSEFILSTSPALCMQFSGLLVFYRWC